MTESKINESQKTQALLALVLLQSISKKGNSFLNYNKELCTCVINIMSIKYYLSVLVFKI